jgi:hypothetical protein
MSGTYCLDWWKLTRSYCREIALSNGEKRTSLSSSYEKLWRKWQPASHLEHDTRDAPYTPYSRRHRHRHTCGMQTSTYSLLFACLCLYRVYTSVCLCLSWMWYRFPIPWNSFSLWFRELLPGIISIRCVSSSIVDGIVVSDYREFLGIPATHDFLKSGIPGMVAGSPAIEIHEVERNRWDSVSGNWLLVPE